MLSQDATRVVFLASEEGSGERVALRRFISADEGESGRDGFLDAIASISRLRHPSLRSVVEGGVDPVDGVPFVATEWVEGEILGELLENAVLSEDDGIVMVFQALDLLGAVQSHSGTKANWLEFRADDIIVRQTGEGPCFTFWTTLARWLSEQDGKEAVGELASLAGRCCGMSAGASPPDSRLGEWLRYVRDNEPSVAEAMGALKAIAQMEHKSAAPTRVLTKNPFPNPAPAIRPGPASLAVKPRSPATGLIVTLSIAAVLVVIGVVTFLVVNGSRDKDGQVAAVEGNPAGKETAELAPDPDPEESGGEAPSPDPPGVEPPGVESPSSDVIAERARQLMEERRKLRERTEFAADEGEDISLKRGETVTVTGKIAEVRQTTSYLYFEFGDEREATDLCIRMAKKSAPGKDLEHFKSYEGQTLVFQGTSEIYGPWNRVCLLLDSPDQMSVSGGE